MPFTLKCFKLKRKRKVKRKLSYYYVQTYKDTLSEMGDECLRIHDTPDTISSIGDEHEYLTSQNFTSVESARPEDKSTNIITNENNNSSNTVINKNLLNKDEIPSGTNGSEESSGDITALDDSSVLESINESSGNNSVTVLEETAPQYSALIDESISESRLATKRLVDIILNDTINGHSNRKSIDVVECREGGHNPQEKHIFRQNTCSDENIMNDNCKEKENGDEILSPNSECLSSTSSGISLSELLQSIFESDNEMSAVIFSDTLDKSSKQCDQELLIKNQKELPEKCSSLFSREELSKKSTSLYADGGLLSKKVTLLDTSGRWQKDHSHLDAPEMSKNAFSSAAPTALPDGSSSLVPRGLKNYVLPDAPTELRLPNNLTPFRSSGYLALPKNSSSDSEENTHHIRCGISDAVENVHRLEESSPHSLEEISVTETVTVTHHDLSTCSDTRCRISNENIPDFRTNQNQRRKAEMLDTFNSLSILTKPVESFTSSSTTNVKGIVPEIAMFGWEITNCPTQTEIDREFEPILSCRARTSVTEASEVSSVETFSKPDLRQKNNAATWEVNPCDLVKVHSLKWKSQVENEKRSIQTTKTKSRGALTSLSSSTGSIYSDGGDVNEPLRKIADEMTADTISEKGEGCLKQVRNTSNSNLTESLQMQKTIEERQEHIQIIPRTRIGEKESGNHITKSLIIIETPKKSINSINAKPEEEKTTQTISLKLLSYNRAENINTPFQSNQRTNRSPSFDLQSFEATHEAYISIFNRYKSEATSCFDTSTRLIPIQSAKSFEFTMNSRADPNNINSFEILSNGKEMEEIDKCGIRPSAPYPNVLSEPIPTVEITIKSKTKESISVPSLVEEDSNKDKNKNECSINRNLHYRSRKIVDQPCHSLNLTPRRKKILSTSKDIRSPKYPVKFYTRSPEMRFHRNTRLSSKFPAVSKLLTEKETDQYRLTKDRVHLKAGRHDDVTRNGSVMSLSDPPPSHRAFSPKELRVKFDETFRRYASKGRMTGDLMSSRRSTEWLKDAGVVGDLLTAEEAKNTFRCAAG
ncbi:uncharacterized protein LOC118181223 isoform X2 [Stegodyphus dumicola]|nr:uncharacterized protein LOC118181223 isoform X2 [Stegodyphus dumicola]